MREMKDSGVEWIGEIPLGWTVGRIKYNYYLKGRIGWQGLKADEFIDEGPYLVTGTDFCRGRVNWGTCYHISEERYEEAPEIHVQINDLLITKDGTVGKVAYIDSMPEKVSLNSHLLIMRSTNREYNNRFLFWVIQSSVFERYFLSSQSGTIMASLSQEKINDFSYAIPSEPQQEHIADYLDSKCSKIDEIIAKQEKIIEKLKEYKLSVITEAVTKGLESDLGVKDSGDSEIGLIPKNSVVMKLKYLCNTQGRIGFKGYTTADLVDEGEGAITLGASHMNNGVIDLTNPVYISWEKYYESPEIMVNQGDILIVQRGSTIGKTAIVDKDYGKVTINPSLVLMNKIRINNKYLLYALSARYIVNQIELIGTNTAIPMISQKQINELKVVVPPKEEQDRIKEYLDSVCRDIDYKILKFETLILKLQAYKKSLIYEVVTGKKEV